jgi:hypothetical protein
MATIPNPEREDLSALMRQALHDLIREQVIHRLGTPDDLLGVEVRPLWGKYYRVNVRTGAASVDARVADSYFLTTDGDGKIVESSPGIVRRY